MYDCVSGFSYSRRQFIINAGAWSVGAALARPFSILAETNSNFPGEPVWTKLSHYGSGVSISGGSVIGFLGGKLPQLTKVHLALCPNALRRSPTFPLSPVYAAGNLIETHEHAGVVNPIKTFATTGSVCHFKVNAATNKWSHQRSIHSGRFGVD